MVVWGVGNSTVGAAWGYLGVRTHVLAMARPPACSAGLCFAAKGLAAVDGGSVPDPKWNPSAVEENFGDVRSVQSLGVQYLEIRVIAAYALQYLRLGVVRGILKMRPVTVFAGAATCVLTGYCLPLTSRVSSFS